MEQNRKPRIRSGVNKILMYDENKIFHFSDKTMVYLINGDVTLYLFEENNFGPLAYYIQNKFCLNEN